MTIRFVDLIRQYERLKPELAAAMDRVMSRASYILGPEVEGFEKAFAAFVGCRHAVGVDSGTSALRLALAAMGLGPGDEVVTVPNTFISTAYAVSALGGLPVFVDVDERTQLMDVSLVEAALTPRTRVILPVHLFGQAADMEAIGALAKRRGLQVLEDACQAHGSAQGGRRAGSFGDAAAFSFYPGKNLGCLGDGGMATTGSAPLAERIRLLRNYGSPVKYRHEMKGENARLDALQAAVLAVKLAHLEDWNRRRARAAARYLEGLRGVGDLVLPWVAPGNEPNWHLFVVRTARRDGLKAALDAGGVETVIHYPIPIHLQPAYAELGLGPGAFPVAERLADEILSLPMHPDLEDAEVEAVIDAVKAFFAGRGGG